MNRSVRTRKGFTLIEATIAMIVLSVATAAVILPFATGATMNMEGAKRAIAAKLAADMIEQIQKIGYDFIDEGPGFPEIGSFYDDQGQPILTDDVYTNYMRIMDCEYISIRGQTLKLVTVTIGYIKVGGVYVEVLKLSRLIGR